MRKTVVLGISAICFTCGFLWASYSAQVQQVPDLKQKVKTIALAPMNCPEDLDCLWVEDELAQTIASYKLFNVVRTEQVRQALFQLGAKSVNDDNRAAVLKQLGADAMVFATVGSAGTKTDGAVGVFTGASVVVAPRKIKHGNVELAVVASDGQLLLQGLANGTSRNGFKSEKGVVLTAFKSILEKAFP